MTCTEYYWSSRPDHIANRVFDDEKGKIRVFEHYDYHGELNSVATVVWEGGREGEYLNYFDHG